MKQRWLWRSVVGFFVGMALIATASTTDLVSSRFGAPLAGEFDGLARSVEGPLGDARLLGELCEVSACVADLVVLPDLSPLEAAVDIEVADTLGALSIERVWTGEGQGVFGRGWTSVLDITVTAGLLSGPVGGRPMSRPLPDGPLDLSDGSRLEFVDGRLVSYCGIGDLCTAVAWERDRIRLTAVDRAEFWVVLELDEGVVSNATAWDGRTVEFVHEDGQLVRTGTTSYDYEGEWLSRVDDGFEPRSFTYEGDVLVAATDRDRAAWTFDATDGEVRVTGARLPTRSYSFDEAKRLTSIVDDLDGVVLSRDYAGSALVSEERPLDSVTMTSVGPGQVSVEQSSDFAPPRLVLYRHDEFGRVAETMEAGVSTRYRYDDRGRIEAVGSTGAETRYQYDVDGLLESTTDPDGFRIEITRSTDGSISVVSDGETTTEFEYDSRGRPTVQRNGSLESRASYGLRGEVSRTTDPGGAMTSYAYDSAGRLLDTEGEFSAGTSTADATSPVEVVEVDSDDDGSEYRYSDGSVIRYDEFGRPLQVTTATGVTETRTYDDAGRVATLVGFDGATHEMAYTPAGRVASLDRDGERFGFTWSGERLVGINGPLGLDVAYTWNDAGSLASAVANGLEWTYHYDAEGNVARVDTPHGAVEATWQNGFPLTLSGPDGIAQMIDWIDGQVASLSIGDEGYVFEYDSGGRVVSVSSRDGNRLEAYRYDGRGRMMAATLGDEEIAVRYGASGVDSVSVGDVTEHWSRSESGVDEIRIDDRVYDVEWAAPGVVGRVSSDGEPLVDVEADSMGRITSISSGDEIHAAFSWDASGFIDARIGDDSLSLGRNSLGLTERYASSDIDYSATYDGSALRSVAIDDISITYQLAGGAVVGSTFDQGSDTARIDWGDGTRVESFTSSEGVGTFVYDAGVASEIRYDDRVRPVSFDDEGRPSAEGTGQEFLDDLFLEDGRPSLGASLPAQSPSIPVLRRLPGGLGISLPQPVSGGDVVDAALIGATPVVPSLLVAGGSDALVERAVSTALARAGQTHLTVDPVRSVPIALFGEDTEATELLSAAPAFVVASSVLDRLGPDSSLISRAFDGAKWTVGVVGDGLYSALRFVFNSPAYRVISGVLFVAAALFCPSGAAVVCNGAAIALQNSAAVAADTASDTEFIQRALIEPLRSFLADLSSLDAGAWVTLVSSGLKVRKAVATTRSGGGRGCGLMGFKCLRLYRSAQAVDRAGTAIGVARIHVLGIGNSSALSRQRDPLSGISSTFGDRRKSYDPPVLETTGGVASVRLIDFRVDGSAVAMLRSQLNDVRATPRIFVAAT